MKINEVLELPNFKEPFDFDDKNINEHQLNSLIKHADDCIKILKKIK